MDGLLVIDKPTGPTSHDVVASMRRVLGERRVGHTGTLDPAATGVLPLVIGQATRLARFLSGREKAYEAEIRLGLATDTYDAEGRPVIPRYEGPWPSREAIEQALAPFRGPHLQVPPLYSAKKVDGRRSYALARRRGAPDAHAAAGAHAAPDAHATPGAHTAPRPGPGLSLQVAGSHAAPASQVAGSPGSPTRQPRWSGRPAPVPVTVGRLDLLAVDGDRVQVYIECSAGFYVRSLAHDLGSRLGIGAHLARLRRTRSGDATLADAVPLALVERNPVAAREAVIPLDRMEAGLPAVVLTDEGVRRVRHGRDVGAHLITRGPAAGIPPFRLLDGAGRLVGIGDASDTPGLLHPSVVLV